MKILIVSDTHRRLGNLDAALEKVGPIDMLIHLGDLEGSEYYIEEMAGCPVHMVSGNNDFGGVLPREKEFFIGKYKVYMTHGHQYYVSMGTDLIKKAGRERQASCLTQDV